MTQYIHLSSSLNAHSLTAALFILILAITDGESSHIQIEA